MLVAENVRANLATKALIIAGHLLAADDGIAKKPVGEAGHDLARLAIHDPSITDATIDDQSNRPRFGGVIFTANAIFLPRTKDVSSLAL